MIKIILAALFITTSIHAKSYLVFNTSSKQSEALRTSYGASEVFSRKEKEILKDSNVNTNVLRLEIGAERFEALQRELGAGNAFIQSNPSQQYFSSEPYESLQWGLNNTGKDLIEWESDIDVTTTAGTTGEDIGIFTIQENGNNKIKVAIIDSGVDVEHPDLAGQILRKEKECAAMEEYYKCLNVNPDRNSCHEKYANFDSDGNGYPMDCNGWNIDSKDIPGAQVNGSPKIYDREGHGTHVAGIIGAKQNKQGIRGVIQNVEIIPVQVGVSTSSGDQQEAPTDKIAKGILYAIQAGAQVINLSLGWRFDQDSLLMRQMIEHAISKDILVVAAAGNDAHDGPVYPCSYEGVICVASHTVNGNLSVFSNYGAHVDIAAPGTKILSAWPSNKRSRFFTQEDAYEYLSGTSQAAPHVAGILARLLNLGYTPKKSLIRLYKGSRPFKAQAGKLIRNGKADLSMALAAGDGAFPYPVNKSPSLVKWDEGDSKRSFVLKLKNLGEDTKELKVKITKADAQRQDEVKVLTGEFTLNEFKSATIKEFRVFFEAPFDSHGEFLFKIDLEYENSKVSYFVQAKAVNIIDGDSLKSNQQIFDIENANNLNDISLNKFDDHTNSATTDLLATKSVNGSTFFSLIAQNGSAYTQTRWQKIPIKDPVILNLSKVDLDLNGHPDYVISLVELGDKERKTRFFAFDENFEGKKALIAPENTYDNELAVMPGGFKWARFEGKMVPSWIAVGQRPETERPSLGPWESPAPELKINRLYLLTEKGIKTVAFREEEELPLHILYQASDSKAQGKITIITGDSFGFYKKYATYTFQNSLKRINEFELFPYMDLLNVKPLPLANASGDNAFFSEKSLGGARVVSIDFKDASATIKQKRLEPMSQKEPIERVLSFDGEKGIFQTQRTLANGDSSLASKVDLRRIKHEILTSETALYLRSSLSPGLTGELISIDTKGELVRKAQWLTLGVNGCQEIGFTREKENEYLVYSCPELKKVIKFQMTR